MNYRFRKILYQLYDEIENGTIEKVVCSILEAVNSDLMFNKSIVFESKDHVHIMRDLAPFSGEFFKIQLTHIMKVSARNKK